MLRKIRILAIVLFMIVATGCASTQLSPENRESISTIALPAYTEVNFEKEPNLFSASQGLAAGLGVALGGAVGGAVGGAISAKNSRSQIIKEPLFAEPEPYPKKIVDLLSKHITSESSFTIAKGEDADAQIVLTVEHYGIATIPFERGYRPYATLTGKIIDQSGKTIWKYRGAVETHHRITQKRLKKRFVNNPELIRKGFFEITDFILRNMALHLSGKPVISPAPSGDVIEENDK